MQKYKLKQDSSCTQSKSNKYHIASISSNKSLIKYPPNHQYKSALSVLNTSDVNHTKSLHHRNKSSKHLQTHTFTNNTHQNSINIPAQSTSHNNSKSNQKGQNQKKKSTGKKLNSINTQSKLLAQTTHGRTSSQYQNLLIQPNNKNQVSKNYKNILKNRKETKEQPSSNQQKQHILGSKSHKDLKQQNHQKSVNISSFKQLKKKTEKSRSKSRQFQNINKKSYPSKKHLITEPSHMTSKQNNINQGNLKKSDAVKKNDKQNKSHTKQNNVILQNFESKKVKETIISEFEAESYEKVPFYMLKSSTNSDIQFSNAEENTVKQLIKKQKMSNKAYFYEGQFEDVVFCKDYYQKEKEQGKISKKQSDKLSKRYSKMNLQLSSQCLNCLTEPDSIQPKGIRHKYANILVHDQEIRSSKRTSQFSSKLDKQSSKIQFSKFRNGKLINNEQLMYKSAIIIQKVWRGYMTRKLLSRFIEEEEMRLFEMMRHIDEMKKERRQIIQSVLDEEQFSKNDSQGQYEGQEGIICRQEAIKIVEEQSNEDIHNVIDEGNLIMNDNAMNSSVNPLDYESQILPRQQAQTMSFIVQINNIGSKPSNLSNQPISVKPSHGQSIDQVLYTSVESIQHLSKVQNIYEQGQDFIINPNINGSEFLKDNSQDQQDLYHHYDEIDQQMQQGQYQQQQSSKLEEQKGQSLLQLQNTIQQRKYQQFRTNFLKKQEQEFKRYNFFNSNNDFLQQKKQQEHSQSYQQKEPSVSYQQSSSFNQPSSIFFKPQQQPIYSRQFSSIHKSSTSKDQSQSYVINQSALQTIGINKREDPIQQQQSSYCIPDQKDESQNQPYQKSKDISSQMPSDFFQENSQTTFLINCKNNQNQHEQSSQSQDLEESQKINDEINQVQVSKHQEILINKKSSNIKQKIQVLGNQSEIQQKFSLPNKSNPNILLLKSPKHQSLSKSYFGHSKSSKKSNEISLNNAKSPNNQNFKKSSSLKEFFFKKSLLGNQISTDNQEVQLQIPTFSSHKLNLLAIPTEKQASSIEQLLHFRHQCLTHQHSAQFKQIQELYVKQKISKQDFLLRLQKLARNFEQSAISIKQAQQDIFNGYKALLKLIKDVLKDCKALGFSQQKGSNVRFCRSMEIFFREKDKISNQKCIFDDEYLWRFDDVMIDQMDKSKHRVLCHSSDVRMQPESQKQKVKQVNKSPVLEERQLSRQSLSHHQLPQFILQNKLEKQTENKITPNKDEIKHIINQKESLKSCNFDISELGSCDDDYFDDDEEKESDFIEFQHDQNLKQREIPVDQQKLNESDSYHMDDDSFFDKNIDLKNSQKKFLQIEVRQDDISENQIILTHRYSQCVIQSSQSHQIDEYQSLRTTQLREVSDIHLVINNRNQQFLDKDHDDQNLLEQQQNDTQQVIPVIKREVYQLSCDSDEDQSYEDKWEIQSDQQQHKLDHFTKKQTKIHPVDLFNRTESVSLYENHHTYQQSQLSKKYSSITDSVQLILVWQFIEEIVVNKNKPQSKNNFGKKITQIAKNYTHQNDYCFNILKNQQNNNENNIVVINEKQLKRNKKTIKNDQTQKSTEHQSRENLSKISSQQINGFLKLFYKEFPTFQENKSKLLQRMYPSPIQLLRSLRDTSMQDYFYDKDKKHRKLSSSDSNSQRNHQHENEQNQSSQKSYAGNSNMDSQTSYLELGSYQFLLSQQLCESLIEKYITEIYDIEMDKKIKAQKQGNSTIKNVRKQFNEYLEMKNPTNSFNKAQNNGLFSPSKLPKQGSFQSIVRTRQLFLQHKEIQSQMLRKQILKIQLHTILDSMNEELIKQRESKCGYSGIGLSELALGTIERTGIQVTTQQGYDTLVNKAKYRLQKFVLNEQVKLNDKLLLQCQQSVTINDSQWVFYVTEALEFGLQITKIIEEYLYEQTVRQISKLQMKRKFRLDDTWIRQHNKMKYQNIQDAKVKEQNSLDNEKSQPITVKAKRVISINIVDSSEKEDTLNNSQQNLIVNRFFENVQQKKCLESQQNSNAQSSQSSFDEENSNYNEKQIQNDAEIIETVRNQCITVDQTKIASSSPIQDQGHLNNMNDSTSNFSYQFNHQNLRNQSEKGYQIITEQKYDCDQQSGEFEESKLSSQKFNQDYSKSFEDSNIQYDENNQINGAENQAINKISNNNTSQLDDSQQQEDSYQLDEDSMQFDEQLDKQLDQMNND